MAKHETVKVTKRVHTEWTLILDGQKVQVTSRREVFMGNARGAAKLEVLSIGSVDVGTLLKMPTSRSTPKTGYAGQVGIGYAGRHVITDFDRDLVVLSIVSAYLADQKKGKVTA